MTRRIVDADGRLVLRNELPAVEEGLIRLLMKDGINPLQANLKIIIRTDDELVVVKTSSIEKIYFFRECLAVLPEKVRDRLVKITHLPAGVTLRRNSSDKNSSDTSDDAPEYIKKIFRKRKNINKEPQKRFFIRKKDK